MTFVDTVQRRRSASGFAGRPAPRRTPPLVVATVASLPRSLKESYLNRCQLGGPDPLHAEAAPAPVVGEPLEPHAVADARARGDERLVE